MYLLSFSKTTTSSYTNEIFETEAKLMIILNDQNQEKISIKQSNITTRISTNIN